MTWILIFVLVIADQQVPVQSNYVFTTKDACEKAGKEATASTPTNWICLPTPLGRS